MCIAIVVVITFCAIADIPNNWNQVNTADLDQLQSYWPKIFRQWRLAAAMCSHLHELHDVHSSAPVLLPDLKLITSAPYGTLNTNKPTPSSIHLPACPSSLPFRQAESKQSPKERYACKKSLTHYYPIKLKFNPVNFRASELGTNGFSSFALDFMSFKLEQILFRSQVLTILPEMRGVSFLTRFLSLMHWDTTGKTSAFSCTSPSWAWSVLLP